MLEVTNPRSISSLKQIILYNATVYLLRSYYILADKKELPKLLVFRLGRS